MSMDVVVWSDEIGDLVLDALGQAGHWTIAQGRAMFRPSTEGPRWSRAVAVLDSGRPVAAAGAFHPRLHPGYEWIHVEVAEPFRRQGLGSLALDEIRRRLPDSARPLRAKVQAG